MKKYTQEDFEQFEIINGYRQCPSGDYSEIRQFGEGCSFGKRCTFGECCRFGESCTFGESCRFGECCRFGESCTFGECCTFGEWCTFGKCCTFGECCTFGKRCSFGEWCRFGRWCSFGRWCRFGESCRFGERCSHEGLTNSKYIAVDRIGSEDRKTYFFKGDEGYFVRAGCWFGSFDEFEKRVKDVHVGTIHEKTYLMALELAKVMLDN